MRLRYTKAVHDFNRALAYNPKFFQVAILLNFSIFVICFLLLCTVTNIFPIPSLICSYMNNWRSNERIESMEYMFLAIRQNYAVIQATAFSALV